MPLSKEDREPRSDRILLVDTKTIDMDRALVNLFMLLKHRGKYPLSRTGVVDRDAKRLAVRLCEDTANFPGFSEQPELVRAWLETDFLDLVFRGTSREALAAPRPVHLNAYKLRNARHCKDYMAAPQLYRLLESDRGLIERLAQFLYEGCDRDTDKYIGAPVDVETLVVLRLADAEGKDSPGTEQAPMYQPVCPGQARVLCDDVRRLLRYEAAMPRPVWVEYLKTLLGFHLALYVRRVGAEVRLWMRDRRIHDACRSCPVDPRSDIPFAGCACQVQYLVDMGDRRDTPMAALSQASADTYFREMEDLIRDLIGLTKLLQFAESQGSSDADTMCLVERALEAYRTDDPTLRGYCLTRINAIVGLPPSERFAQVRDQFSGDPFRAYVECILMERFGFNREAFRRLFRSVLSPNKDTGLLAGGLTARSASRFHMGTRLLEALVQVAVMKPRGQDGAGNPRFASEPMLVSELLSWLHRRYGIAIGAAQAGANQDLTPPELRALRANEDQFKARLREIGFLTDLSDAYNAQRIIPRYRVEQI